MSASGYAVTEPRQTARPVARSRGKKKRLRFIIAGLIMVAALAYMIYSAVAANSEYYLTVSEAYAMGEEARASQIKVGGTVVAGSIVWDRGSNAVSFSIVDEVNASMPITYSGIVPDSFQPGAEVILGGMLLEDGSFAATTLLAKCASKYEPEISGAGG
jgi:cytochrome c-type biogenesis protein CcmE